MGDACDLERANGSAFGGPGPGSCPNASCAGYREGRDLSGHLARLVGDIGRRTYETSLAQLLISAAAIDQCNIFKIEGERARCLYYWDRTHLRSGPHLVERYLAGPVAADPILRRLRRYDEARQSISFVRCEEIEDDWYRRTFFEAPALGGKMSIYEVDDGCGLYLNFYTARMSEFSPLEIGNLSWLSKVISVSLIRHHENLTSDKDSSVIPMLASVSRLLGQGASRLTEREREVCSRIVVGYTTEAIALDLGISYGSVATYRRRAYGKLSISSHHELFALCLDATNGARANA